MIAASLAGLRRYGSLHPAFARALDFLEHPDLHSLQPGRHEIDGDRLYVSIDRFDGQGHGGARLEVHRRYIDIQVTIDGDEEIGWMPLDECRRPAGSFDETKDVGFFEDAPATWIRVPPGDATIFFPEDAHAPRGGTGSITKAIVKVAVVW